MELLALLLLIPLFQSGFESSSTKELETARLEYLASVPSVREDGGRLHIEPPGDAKLTMRVVRLAAPQKRRGPAAFQKDEMPGAAQEMYVVIVSAP